MNEWQKALMEIAAVIEARDRMARTCGDMMAPQSSTAVAGAIRTVVKSKVVSEKQGSK